MDLKKSLCSDIRKDDALILLNIQTFLQNRTEYSQSGSANGVISDEPESILGDIVIDQPVEVEDVALHGVDRDVHLGPVLGADLPPQPLTVSPGVLRQVSVHVTQW